MFLGIVLVIIIAVILGLAASRPGSFRVVRSIVVHAPAAKSFSLVNDFHQWGEWSPWEKLDPAMKKTFSGALSGAGSVYEWEGNKKVGKGRMEILTTVADARIVIKLDFFKPFEAHNTTEFLLSVEGNATRVTWAMFGPQPFMGKLMSLFLDMDKMIGKDFERGLAQLKAAAER
jgi:hypothetical protein